VSELTEGALRFLLKVARDEWSEGDLSRRAVEELVRLRPEVERLHAEVEKFTDAWRKSEADAEKLRAALAAAEERAAKAEAVLETIGANVRAFPAMKARAEAAERALASAEERIRRAEAEVEALLFSETGLLMHLRQAVELARAVQAAFGGPTVRSFTETEGVALRNLFARADLWERLDKDLTQDAFREETAAAAYARAEAAEQALAGVREALRDLVCAVDTDGSCDVKEHEQPCGCALTAANENARCALSASPAAAPPEPAPWPLSDAASSATPRTPCGVCEIITAMYGLGVSETIIRESESVAATICRCGPPCAATPPETPETAKKEP